MGALTIPISALGLLLGLVGFVLAIARRGHGLGFPIAGLGVSLAAFVVALVVTYAIGRAVDHIGKELTKKNETNQGVVPNSKPSTDPRASLNEGW